MKYFLTADAFSIDLMYWEEYALMRYSHTHSLYELYFCPDNIKQRSVINGVEYNYCYPCVIISSPYTVHAMSSDDDPAKGYRRYVFNFEGSIVDQFDARLLPPGLLCRNTGFMFRLTEEDAAYLVRLIDAFHAETKTEKKLLLVTFLNKLVQLSPFEDALKVGKSSFYVQDVLQYIAEHYTENIDAGAVAHHFSISRSKLDRDFKQFTGITIHGYLDMCRLNQAKMLLEHHTEMSVSEIAVAVGFSGETYFFPFFKKYTGITPIEFRNGKRAK